MGRPSRRFARGTLGMAAVAFWLIAAGPAWGQAPTVYGSRLHVPPGESPTAKVLALTEQQAVAKAENERLSERVRSLETELDSARAEHRAEVEEILRQLGDITSRLRKRLDW